ncbi:MAG TPA: hypothetical protein PK156_18025 [Polyangium sp.]|nr:hypothetical protein [Polyangium sp.]
MHSIVQTGRLFLRFGMLLVSGCTAATVPLLPDEQKLLTIEAPNARVPVMLSKVPTSDRGRQVSATSGLTESHTHIQIGTLIQYDADNIDSSEVPASVQISRGPQAGDRWLQIDYAAYQFGYGSSYGTTGQQRTLNIDGSVHR